MNYETHHRDSVVPAHEHDGSLHMDDVVQQFRHKNDMHHPALDTAILLSPAEQQQRYVDAVMGDLGVLSWARNVDTTLSSEEHQLVRAGLAIDTLPISELAADDESDRTGAYEKYLKNLRSLRRAQAEDPYVKERLQLAREAPTPEERKRLYLEAVSFSPAMATKTLGRLNKKSRIFTNDTLQKAASSPAAFEQALQQCILKNPEEILESLDVVRLLLPHETLKASLLKGLSANSSWLLAPNDKLYDALLLLCPEQQERKEVIEKLVEKHLYSFVGRLLDGSFNDVLSIEYRKTKARQGVLEDKYGDASDVVQGLEQGFWTQDEINTVASRLIDDGHRWQVEQLAEQPGLLAPDIVERLQEARVTEMLDQADTVREYLLKDINTESVDRILQAALERNPAGALAHLPKIIKERLSADAIRELCLSSFDAITETGGVAFVLGTDTLTRQDKQAIIELHAGGDPELFLTIYKWSYGDAANYIGKEQFAGYVRDAMHRVPSGQMSTDLLEIYAYCFEDREEFRALISGACAEGASVVGAIVSGTFGGVAVCENYFSKSEREGLLDSWTSAASERGVDSVNQAMVESVAESFGAQKAKEMLLTFAKAHPIEYSPTIADTLYFFDASEVDGVVRDMLGSADGKVALIANLDIVRNSGLNAAEVVAAIIQEGIANEAFLVDIEDQGELPEVLGPDRTRELAMEIRKRNPALGLLYPESYARLGMQQDDTAAVQEALANEPASSYMSDLFDRALKTQNQSIRTRSLAALRDAYKDIATLKKRGEMEAFRAFASQAGMDSTQFRQALELCARVDGSVPKPGEPASYDALYQIAVERLLSSEYGMGVTPQELEVMRGVTEGSTSVFVYAAGKKRWTAQHTEVLGDMFKKVANGKAAFEDWRFGGTVEELDRIQSLGLLPEKLTREQFIVWRNESTSTSVDTFTLEADAAASGVKEVIETSAAELGLSYDEIATTSADEVANELAAVGNEIGQLHKQRKLLTALPDQAMAARQVEAVTVQAAKLTAARTELQIRYDAILLTQLDATAITNGVVGEKNGKKGTPIVNVTNRLAKNIGPDNAHIVTRVRTVLEGYATQTGQMQEMTVTDTVDVKTTFEIGSSPVESCQHYRDGMYNQALLGYTEPNTKLLVLRGESGRPIARSILRFLEDKDGSPSLYMETIYTAQASSAVAKALRLHAITKAEELGVPLYGSSQKQAEVGYDERKLEGIVSTYNTGQRLHSRAGRAPCVYVDSSGGIRAGGVYTIRNLVEFSRA